VDTLHRASWWLLALAVGGVAFLARLIPVLRSGGLDGIGQYDAAVYFGSAVSLIHGRLPYRDFLLLHPPGSTVALAPFAALGRVIGDDSLAWATARVAMMALGSLTAVLVARVLRPVGLLPALLGGLCYAVLLPAVAIETTTRLEPLAACCLAAALVLLCVEEPRTALRPWSVALAGALLGYAATVKIWGALPLVVVAVHLLIMAGVRRAGAFTAGAAIAGVVVCLPFLLAAPTQMWRQVVRSQFGRDEANRSNLERLADITGLIPIWNRFGEAATWVVVGASILVVIAAIVALRVAQTRLAVVLLAALAVLLMSTPTWFGHYAGLSAGVLAITLGAAAAAALRAVSHPVWRPLVAGLGGIALVAAAAQLSQVEFGERFPARRVAASVGPLPGCITADDPGVLLRMNTLSRNLRRGCPLVLDLGGHSYEPGGLLPRQRDPRWQRFFLDYMAGGTATMKVRYHTGFGLARDTARTVNRWPVIAEIDGFELRRPIR
jgi:alpha-1,2-mannosyltransferase